VHNNRARNVRIPLIENSLDVKESLGVCAIGEEEFQGNGLVAVSIHRDKGRTQMLV
jgi:hypothetical protein